MTPLTVLIAARDEEQRIAATIGRLREALGEVEIVVADDGSRDRTAVAAEQAGARVVRLPARGKGQALTAAERELPAGPLLLCDADLVGDPSPLASASADLAIAAFQRRGGGGGFGLAKRAARALIRLRTGFSPAEPLSGQRHLSPAARQAVFPVAAGFGVETRMTIDAHRAGLRVVEVELPLGHRATGRDLRGFLHRGRQLHDLVLACLPQAVNHRGMRLPLLGGVTGLLDPAVLPVCLAGLADDLWAGPERGFRAHLRSGATTGTLKLVAIPLYGLLRTRSLSGALVVGLAANVVNQLDTRPGRALKAFALGSALVGTRRGTLASVVLVAPYDLREMGMLGDAGANTLGAVLGLRSVERTRGLTRIGIVGALAALTVYGDRRSFGTAIDRSPPLRALDRLGRPA